MIDQLTLIIADLNANRINPIQAKEKFSNFKLNYKNRKQIQKIIDELEDQKKEEMIACLAFSLFEASDDIELYNTLNAVSVLAINNRCATLILVHNGLIPSLIARSKHSVAGVRRAAAGALRGLAYHVESGPETDAIRLEGGIELLIHLLEDTDELVIEQAVGALWNLSNNAENREVMRNTGHPPGVFIPRLVALLKHSAAGVRRAAAGALKGLAYHVKSGPETDAIRLEGGIELLIHLLEDTDESVIKQAVEALWNLTGNAENREVMRNTGHPPGVFIPRLVALLKHSAADVRRAAAGALKRLAYFKSEPEIRVILMESDIDVIFNLLEDPNESVKEQATLLVKNLAQNLMNHVILYCRAPRTNPCLKILGYENHFSRVVSNLANSFLDPEKKNVLMSLRSVRMITDGIGWSSITGDPRDWKYVLQNVMSIFLYYISDLKNSREDHDNSDVYNIIKEIIFILRGATKNRTLTIALFDNNSDAWILKLMHEKKFPIEFEKIVIDIFANLFNYVLKMHESSINFSRPFISDVKKLALTNWLEVLDNSDTPETQSSIVLFYACCACHDSFLDEMKAAGVLDRLIAFFPSGIPEQPHSELQNNVITALQSFAQHPQYWGFLVDSEGNSLVIALIALNANLAEKVLLLALEKKNNELNKIVIKILPKLLAHKNREARRGAINLLTEKKEINLLIETKIMNADIIVNLLNLLPFRSSVSEEKLSKDDLCEGRDAIRILWNLSDYAEYREYILANFGITRFEKWLNLFPEESVLSEADQAMAKALWSLALHQTRRDDLLTSDDFLDFLFPKPSENKRKISTTELKTNAQNNVNVILSIFRGKIPNDCAIMIALFAEQSPFFSSEELRQQAQAYYNNDNAVRLRLEESLIFYNYATENLLCIVRETNLVHVTEIFLRSLVTALAFPLAAHTHALNDFMRAVPSSDYEACAHQLLKLNQLVLWKSNPGDMRKFASILPYYISAGISLISCLDKLSASNFPEPIGFRNRVKQNIFIKDKFGNRDKNKYISALLVYKNLKQNIESPQLLGHIFFEIFKQKNDLKRFSSLLVGVQLNQHIVSEISKRHSTQPEFFQAFNHEKRACLDTLERCFLTATECQTVLEKTETIIQTENTKKRSASNLSTANPTFFADLNGGNTYKKPRASNPKKSS
ncbi:MAG: hypothetical protein V4496_07520 [Pseudomonadota bacterium]